MNKKFIILLAIIFGLCFALFIGYRYVKGACENAVFFSLVEDLCLFINEKGLVPETWNEFSVHIAKRDGFVRWEPKDLNDLGILAWGKAKADFAKDPNMKIFIIKDGKFRKYEKVANEKIRLKCLEMGCTSNLDRYSNPLLMLLCFLPSSEQNLGDVGEEASKIIAPMIPPPLVLL